MPLKVTIRTMKESLRDILTPEERDAIWKARHAALNEGMTEEEMHAQEQRNSRSSRSCAEALKQADNQKRQKDEFLQTTVIQTDPVTGIIQWHMWSKVPGLSGSLGHGVHYHDSARTAAKGPDGDIVAFIRGFAWNRPNVIIRGYYIQPDEITSKRIIEALKVKIEKLVAIRRDHYLPRPGNWITKRIYAAGNC
jgi:hypothetical protein